MYFGNDIKTANVYILKFDFSVFFYRSLIS